MPRLRTWLPRRRPPPMQKCSPNGRSIWHPSTLFPRTTWIMRGRTIVPRPRPCSQYQANVELARINLGYANVTAPIAARAGQQQVTEGALVGPGGGDVTDHRRADRSHLRELQSGGDRPRATAAARRRTATCSSSTEQGNGGLKFLRRHSLRAQAARSDFFPTRGRQLHGLRDLRAIVPNPGAHPVAGPVPQPAHHDGAQTGLSNSRPPPVQSGRCGLPSVVTVDGGDKAVVPNTSRPSRLDGDAWIARRRRRRRAIASIVSGSAQAGAGREVRCKQRRGSRPPPKLRHPPHRPVAKRNFDCRNSLSSARYSRG